MKLYTKTEVMKYNRVIVNLKHVNLEKDYSEKTVRKLFKMAYEYLLDCEFYEECAAIKKRELKYNQNMQKKKEDAKKEALLKDLEEENKMKAKLKKHKEKVKTKSKN